MIEESITFDKPKTYVHTNTRPSHSRMQTEPPGNEQFKVGKIEDAIGFYTRAIEILQKGDPLGGGGVL